MKKLHHVTMMVLVFLHLGIKLILGKLLCSSTLMRKKKHCPITMREKCSNINYKIVNRKMISYKTFVLAHCHLTEFLYSIEIKKKHGQRNYFQMVQTVGLKHTVRGLLVASDAFWEFSNNERVSYLL